MGKMFPVNKFHVSLCISMQDCFHCNNLFSKKWKWSVS